MPSIKINMEGAEKLMELENKMEKIKSNNRKNASKYYKKNYTYREGMTPEERLVVDNNIAQRKIVSAEKYDKKREHYRLKQREYRARFKEKKELELPKLVLNFD